MSTAVGEDDPKEPSPGSDSEDSLEEIEIPDPDFGACDKCYRKAYVRFSKGNLELAFCLHDSRAMRPSLLAAGWDVEDISELMNRKP